MDHPLSFKKIFLKKFYFFLKNIFDVDWIEFYLNLPLEGFFYHFKLKSEGIFCLTKLVILSFPETSREKQVERKRKETQINTQLSRDTNSETPLRSTCYIRISQIVSEMLVTNSLDET